MIRYAIAGVTASLLVFVFLMPSIEEKGMLVLYIKTHNIPDLDSYEITFEKIEVYKVSTLSGYIDIPKLSTTGSLGSCSRKRGSYIEGSCVELSIEGGWRTFLSEPKTFDLTDPELREEKELSFRSLNVGGYYIIRLVMGGDMPENIRLLKTFRIQKDQTKRLVLDFDVAEFIENVEESITISEV